ncbi:hypothetical protein [Chryseobacterium sp. c4a]|uniref:hypothetical protein n=1 Tax=Chryseobacterium sp. c4a TaxID=1573582 RepID=UPI0013589492|nr:hypothetical protein [Chryseobacterium sp. c4a]
MASKQLNFFITPDEYERINKMILERNIVVLVKQNISITSEIVISKILPPIEDEIFQVYLSTPQFLDKIIVLSTDNGKKYFDLLRSYLLEFSVGGFYPYDRNILQRARFYYVKSFWNDQDILEKKSDDFIQWCDNFIIEFRKEFLNKYSKGDIFLYSDSAIKWIEENDATLINGGQQWKTI